MLVNARLYDGKSSKEHEVIIDFTFGRRVKIASHQIDVALEDIVIESRLGNTPRVIEFPNGIRCKSDENNNIDQVLLDFNLNKSKTHKIESSVPLTIGSVLLTIGFVWFMLTAGADYSAKFLANVLPQSSLNDLSELTLEQLEDSLLEESNLTATQQKVIQAHFDKLAGDDSRYKLHFRSAPQMGANAFALPSGDIVLTDELVALSKDSKYRDILGVLAHEKGHVVEKHSLRMAIKTGIASVIIGYVTGDISMIASTIPTILLNSSYSRDFEREADAHAIKEMDKMHVSTLYMADLFLALSEEHKELESNSTIDSLMASHPLTEERIRYFKNHAHK
jgi:Zn-dependent protease with chaperone function